MQRVDPARLEGNELDRWYRRTPDEIEAERQQAHRDAAAEFYGGASSQPSPEDEGWGDGQAAGRGWVQVGPNRYRAASHSEDDGAPPAQWQEAKVAIRPPMVLGPPEPVVRAPAGPMVGSPIDGRPSMPGPRGRGFFGRYHPTDHLDAYVTGLPSPLTIVTPQIGGWFSLSNGGIAGSADEVERLYDEQQRRLQGSGEDQPQAVVISEDRLKDGHVPRADQIAKGHREVDPTCHPDGGWEPNPSYKGYPQWTRDYEAQITRAPGLEYVVRPPGGDPVKFDGCAVWDPRHELLEAKGPGYSAVLDAARQYGFESSIGDKASNQASRQAKVAGRRPIDWHVAEPDAAEWFGERVPIYGAHVVYTPAR